MVFQPDEPFREIKQATFLISRRLVEANAAGILAKTDDQDIRFRPHFKTHQHLEVGRWLRDMGISAITVSSLDMAEAFLQDGWQDITIAIPCNLRELDRLDRLAARCRLHVIVDHPATLAALDRISSTIHVWIEVDTGAGRTGIPIEEEQAIAQLWSSGLTLAKVHMEGLLWHDGQFYQATRQSIQASWNQNLHQLTDLQNKLARTGSRPALSAGDTPSSILLDDLSGVDEIRAGNLIYFDLMQAHAGVCHSDQIAVALAAPVIGHYPRRGQMAVHAGAVHLSKEHLLLPGNRAIYGQMVDLTPRGWTIPNRPSWVSHISQEHGLIEVESHHFEQYPIGSLVGILPVHSCLAADAMKERSHLLI